MAPRPRDPTLPRRRQNKSCDQCREGKRRCDVQLRVQFDPVTQIIHTSPSPLLPCTNCTRWKKGCTVEWIRSREKRKASFSPEFLHQQQQEALLHTTASADDVYSTGDSVLLSWHQNGITMQPSRGSEEMAFLGDLSQCYGSVGLQSPISCDPSVSIASLPYSSDESIAYQTSGSDLFVVPSLAGAVNAYAEYDGEYAQDRDDDGLYVDESSVRQHVEDRVLEIAHSDLTSRIPHPSDRWEKRIDSIQYPSTPFINETSRTRSPSPFTANLLAEDWNRLAIKKGLLKIYHDSMEGALSCWLTERNCPYSSAVFDDGREVWGSNWANRIVTRVCDLDRVYSSTGALSVKDQRQAAKVLNLVVMAFASQWSQTGQRGNSRLHTSATASPSSHSYSGGPLDGERDTQKSMSDDAFGRDMQKSLWHQANKALGEASDNVSFRVIFAGIIFSLAQRPIDGAEVLRDLNSGEDSELSALFKILDLDGPPICLDVSLRKLLDHQRRMEEGRQAGTNGRHAATRVAQKISGVHKETFGLLCWLGVMFDTLSAAVNRRSFTVCDTDSNFSSNQLRLGPTPQLDGLSVDLDGWFDFSSDEANTLRDPGVDIWGDYFLHQHSQAGDARKQNIRWPCSYDDAASCLADAAPVKVLLFRRVAHLQDLSYRHSSGVQIEKALEAVMEVYIHWNETYGLFIDDCIRHHEELPARIQSWYILLAGHWNLAMLIASDVIQKLDDLRISLPSNRRGRDAIGFTRSLRTRAAYEVSDLGRCSQYGIEDLSFSQSPEFHHAVNKAALLTEPWTQVLVRAFGYAGAFLVRQVASQSRAVPEADAPRTRVQYCVNALWLLGKKSDMALCAAQVLRQAVM